MDDGGEKSKNDADTSSIDCSLDSKTYPKDFVSELFNSINWDERVRNPRPERHWIDPASWDSKSYSMKYLEYKIEEGQVDLTNPFHIEECNKIRSRLDKKTKVKLNSFGSDRSSVSHCVSVHPSIRLSVCDTCEFSLTALPHSSLSLSYL